MAKNKKLTEAEQTAAETEVKQAKAEVVANKKTPKASKKAKSEKKGGIGKKFKETASELKKVNWPTFSQVVKKTGVVLAVVIIFAVVLFGIHYLLGLLFNWLTSAIAG